MKSMAMKSGILIAAGASRVTKFNWNVLLKLFLRPNYETFIDVEQGKQVMI